MVIKLFNNQLEIIFYIFYSDLLIMIVFCSGGDSRIRTGDLRIANATL